MVTNNSGNEFFRPVKILARMVTSVPCPSFPWCFCFLGVFVAATFLGLFECFLLTFRVLKRSQGEKNPWCFEVFLG